jgi:DNA-binding LytR/AlgR family response regulator
MTRPTALIAEDETPQRQELLALLAELWPELNVIAECEDGLSALEALEQHHPQIAFLDIRMPGVSGLEVARAAAAQCQVIFITAYEEYALQAFDKGAVDYLLKPVARERLSVAIERARSRLAGGAHVDMAALIDMVQARLAADSKPGIRWITVSVGNAVKMYSIDEVLFFQAQDKYTRVVTATSEGHIRTPLKELVAASQCSRARGCHPCRAEGRRWQAAAHRPRPLGCAAREQHVSAPLQGDVTSLALHAAERRGPAGGSSRASAAVNSRRS